MLTITNAVECLNRSATVDSPLFPATKLMTHARKKDAVSRIVVAWLITDCDGRLLDVELPENDRLLYLFFWIGRNSTTSDDEIIRQL